MMPNPPVPIVPDEGDIHTPGDGYGPDIDPLTGDEAETILADEVHCSP